MVYNNAAKELCGEEGGEEEEEEGLNERSNGTHIPPEISNCEPSYVMYMILKIVV